ncbi:polyadenylate-binding protein-interacting protein 1 [Ostrinia furnacalis]|uniref:polyadenylate-binding protein-interacting protein 1 n=1 Tax=Ostrinia furnacalis TaxID=93504 RepID=UPI00103B81F6|nr:polyadenylate-binding protein-interacting protein 1 [Ostrinia furnacalis]
MNNGEVGGPRGRGRGWQQPENQPRELRRPRIVTEDAKAEPPKIESNLSAEAKEWYPPNYNPQSVPAYAPDPAPYRPHRFSVQDRLRQAQDQNLYNFDDMSYSLEEQENMDLRENIANLITVMCEITFDPGKFDTLCGPLVDSFAHMLHDANYTRALVEAIVNQSIGESNFRYNGARLCSMYDSVAAPEESTFRVCLLERCSTEENKIISGVETSEENMRGFAMFLAEIYTQLEDSQGGRIKTLGESLCKVLLHLLDTDKDTNIKSVCQLLKLSGIALDADCPTGMHAAFERLKRRAQLPCVRAVVALRGARWGLAEREPEPLPARIIQGGCVEFVWVKAHAGLEGNETADEAAKSAASSQRAPDFSRFPISHVKRGIREINQRLNNDRVVGVPPEPQTPLTIQEKQMQIEHIGILQDHQRNTRGIDANWY